ncbi:MAG: DUF3368 domain-containing protein [Bacteroidia bacterium]
MSYSVIVVSDTSPISNLIDLGQLTLLRALFNQVVIPTAVESELLQVEDPQFRHSYLQSRESGWLIVKSPVNLSEVNRLKQILDPGEAEAISLALELNAQTLLIDERMGYKVAHQSHLRAVGVLGILIEAKRKGLIPDVRSYLDKLKYEIGFWVSDNVYRHVLNLADER